MNSKELIEKAIQLSGEPKVIGLLEQFLRANLVIKDAKFDLSKFVDKYNPYAFAKGIYHKDGYRYFTDGVVMASIKSEYDAAFEDKIISPKGEIIDTQFPNWRYAMDRIGIMSELRLQQSIQEICRIVRENEEIAKAGNKKLILSINHDETLTYFSLRKFSLFLLFLKTYRDAVIYIRDNYCLYACDGENFCITLCQKIDSNYLDDYMIVPL